MASDSTKMMKMFISKPSKMLNFKNHNIKKPRKYGLNESVCRRCGYRGRGMIMQYDLHYCRRCFREIASELGFKKYS